jgi:hypothetical protein
MERPNGDASQLREFADAIGLLCHEIGAELIVRCDVTSESRKELRPRAIGAQGLDCPCYSGEETSFWRTRSSERGDQPL